MLWVDLNMMTCVYVRSVFIPASILFVPFIHYAAFFFSYLRRIHSCIIFACILCLFMFCICLYNTLIYVSHLFICYSHLCATSFIYHFCLCVAFSLFSYLLTTPLGVFLTCLAPRRHISWPNHFVISIWLHN